MKKLTAVAALSIAFSIVPAQAFNKEKAKEVAKQVTTQYIVPAGEFVLGLGGLIGANKTTLAYLNEKELRKKKKDQATHTTKSMLTTDLKQLVTPNSKLKAPFSIKQRAEVTRNYYGPMVAAATLAMDGARRISTNAYKAAKKAYANHKKQNEEMLLS